jgi:hypothetical protein
MRGQDRRCGQRELGAMRAEAGIDEWTLVDGVPGSVYGVAVDPARPSTVYAIAAGTASRQALRCRAC